MKPGLFPTASVDIDLNEPEFDDAYEICSLLVGNGDYYGGAICWRHRRSDASPMGLRGDPMSLRGHGAPRVWVISNMSIHPTAH